jgi:hypothetical protein
MLLSSVDQPLLSRLFRKVSLHRPCHKFAVSVVYQKQLSEAVMSCERGFELASSMYDKTCHCPAAHTLSQTMVCGRQLVSI